MAIRTRDEIMEAIRKRIGDDTSDEALALIEDLSDTMTDYESYRDDKNDWKKKYETLDSEWRERYKSRFFDGGFDTVDTSVIDAAQENIVEKKTTFESLFKEGE